MHPRGVCEIRDLGAMEYRIGHAEDFSQNMKEIQEQLKKTITKANHKLKAKVDI